MDNADRPRKKFFYGYWVLLAVFAGVFIFAGGGLYAFSFFVIPLQTDMGWDRSTIMLGNTVWFLFMGFASPLVGRLVDRHGARRVIAAGAVLTGLGFTALSQMHELWLYYASYAVIGVGMAALGQVPASAVVSNWFVKRRGLAIGVMSLAVGVGGLVVSPVLGGYILPVMGWRTAYFSLALLTWVLILPLAAFVIKTKPQEKGLYPDGMSREEFDAIPRASAKTTGGLSLKMALATPAFWLIATCFLLHMFAQNGIMQTNVPHLTDVGFSTTLVATVIGAVGIMSAFGKFGFGWLCDWIKAKFALAIGLALQLAAIAVIMTIDADSSMVVLWIYAVLIGLGIGSWLPTMSILVSTNFGLVSYGAIFGVVSLLNNIGGSLGPFMAGKVYDATGTYQPAFTVFLILFAVSIPMILLVKKPAALS